jgi:hypothetical protein
MATFPLKHSPADILRRVFISMGLGSDPDEIPLDDWPIYSSGEPPSPDEVLTVKRTQGRGGDRSQVDGSRTWHYGFQIRCRSGTSKIGQEKLENIAHSLNEDLYRAGVTIDSTSYCVHSVTLTSDVLDMGKESPASRRSLASLNGTAYIIALN